MTNDKKYNGWTNYETWCVNLWLTGDGEEFRQEEMNDLVRSCKGKEPYDTGQAIKEYVNNLKDNEEPHMFGLFDDLLSASLSEVDWLEIAEGYIEEITNEDLDEVQK